MKYVFFVFSDHDGSLLSFFRNLFIILSGNSGTLKSIMILSLSNHMHLEIQACFFLNLTLAHLDRDPLYILYHPTLVKVDRYIKDIFVLGYHVVISNSTRWAQKPGISSGL